MAAKNCPTYLIWALLNASKPDGFLRRSNLNMLCALFVKKGGQSSLFLGFETHFSIKKPN